MKEPLRFQLGHPLLIFIWSLSMFLIGCAIGTHWHPSLTVALWIAISGAALAVIHDLCQAFMLCALTAWWIGVHNAGRS
jgi:hypothetical protein